MWQYVAQYQHEHLKFYGQVMPFGPEKLVLGVFGKQGKRLDTSAEFKVDQNDQTEATLGFRAKFAAGEVRGSLSSTGKVTTVYRKFVQMLELEFQSSMNLANTAQPVTFGMGLSMRQM